MYEQFNDYTSTYDPKRTYLLERYGYSCSVMVWTQYNFLIRFHLSNTKVL